MPGPRKSTLRGERAFNVTYKKTNFAYFKLGLFVNSVIRTHTHIHAYTHTPVVEVGKR